MRTHIAVAALAVAVISMAGASPAQATRPAGAVHLADASAVIGVLGDLPAAADGSVSIRDLDVLTGGLATPAIDRALSGEQAASTGPSTQPLLAKAAATSSIRYAWNDFKNRYTPIRQNVLTKIESLHNVTYKVARATTKYPAPGKAWLVSGQKWNYETPAYEVKCSGWWIFRSCKVVRTVWVIASVDFRKIADGKPYGVVTTYCKGISGKCPDFVKNALNI